MKNSYLDIKSTEKNIENNDINRRSKKCRSFWL